MIEKILTEICRLKKDLEGYSAVEALDYIESYINILQQEQSAENLDAEIDRFYRSDEYKMSHELGRGFEAIAYHFFDFGCRYTAVMYDDIEYERQRAEETEPSGDLEEVAKEYTHANMYDGWDYERIYNAFIAGAEWRREQMMEEWLKDRDGCFWDGVEEGKKAMEKQMLENVVDGRYMKADGKVYVESWPIDIDPDSVKAGDEVRLIVLPEEK